MSSLHETAYPRLKSEVSLRDLQDLYTPSIEEYEFAGSIKKPIARLGFLLHLKLFQRLGYFIALSEVPAIIIEHIVVHGRFQKSPTQKQLTEYDKSGTKARHQSQIRQQLGVKPFTSADTAWLTDVATRAAETREMLPDIINVMLEELVRACFELPGFTVLQRLAFRVRNEVNERCFSAITSQLSDSARQQIDELLTHHRESYSAWHALKREPKKPGNKEVRSYLQHVHWLRALGSQMPDVHLPVVKYRQFALEARALDAGEIAALKPSKRYALAAILIRSQYSKALDDVAELFIRIVRSLETNAQAALQKYLLDHQKNVDALIGRFKDVLTAYHQAESDTERLAGIHGVIGEDTPALIERCDEHMAYAGNNYLPFMLAPYRQKRALVLNCLKLLDLNSTSSDRSTLGLLRLLKSLRSSRLEHLTREAIEQMQGSPLDPAAMPERWRKLIMVRARATRDELCHRKYLELWILSVIKQELLSGDLHIPSSEQFDDYREQLVDDETLDRELGEYAAQVELPLTDAKVFVSELKTQLIEASRAIDRSFPQNVHADIVEGRLVLKKAKTAKPSAELAKLDEIITDRLPSASIIDVLTDTEKWLGLHKLFSPLSGNESRLNEPEKRFITTLFCYGCNLGPSQTARSIKGINRRQIAWLNLKHVTEKRLDKAITQVINAYNRFDLPKCWGTGKHASVDGTKWDLYEQNLLSEYHIRYGGYGGIGYYHVSDTYIALFSHFISCGTYEAIYILDGLMSNRSDIQPDTLHGDTQSQSYPVFGLSHLLGIKLMPRIRNLQDLKLYRPDRRFRYQNIDSLFSNASIDFGLIETHLRDMLKVAVSIKKGQITASTILRRLGTYSRKNKLYQAFQELGKVIRTLFLLRYISEIELRQTINAATNKSEEFNGFTKWLFFGGEGVIAENVRHEQRKIVKFNHLVANLVILHNVETMTRLIRTLVEEGVVITRELLAGLSPYRTSHINRFGDYLVDLERVVEPLSYRMKLTA